MKICIDPGHSGPVEPGACAGGATEAAINLQVAKILGKMLENAGHNVVLTRVDDIEDITLTWRCEVAWKFRADLFICIHCNAHEDTEAHGTETWYYETSERGRNLARCIQAAIVANCGTTDRGVKSNDKWTVLEGTTCPAVLVELAFITNDEERGRLIDPFLQRQFAVGISNGIEQFAKGGSLFGGVAERRQSYDIRAFARRR